jgi:hypothetical protein
MNFAWLVRSVEGQTAFLILGVGLPLVILGVILGIIASRGLFRE